MKSSALTDISVFPLHNKNTQASKIVKAFIYKVLYHFTVSLGEIKI